MAPTVLPGMPAYVTGMETSDVVLAAMLATLPPGLDGSQGGFVWDALAPASVQLAQAAVFATQQLLRSFMATSYGAYLDNRASEHGVFRLPAVVATGSVTFTGAATTVIPLGSQVSTATTSLVPAQVFVTTQAGTIVGTTATVPVVALVAGKAGNVIAGSVIYPITAIAGVTGVSNLLAMSGGLDLESDAAFITRYLVYVANPPAGGNAADYYNWAIVVPGVGAVSVVPIWNGNGTVGVYLLDTNKVPATQSLIDAVQKVIAPPLTIYTEPIVWTINGTAPTLDASAQADAQVVPTVKFVYAAGSFGRLLSAPPFQSYLTAAGVWTFRLRSKVSSIALATPLLRFGIWNSTTFAWCGQTVAARLPTDAGYLAARSAALTAAQLSTAFADVILPFAWNGTDVLTVDVNADFVAVANPTVAAALTKSAAATSLLAGVYTVAYTYVNGLGETMIGTTTNTITILAGDQVIFTPPAFPAGVSLMNVYMSIAAGSATLKLVAVATVPGAIGIVALPFAWAAAVPGANTALVGDATTTLWVDQSRSVSTFSSLLGAGKAPIGAQVTVQAPAIVTVNVAATLTLVTGSVVATVRAACTAAVTAYLASVAFAVDPTVRWSHLASAISAVPGVQDFSALTANGGTANIVVPGTSVAVLGTAVWS